MNKTILLILCLLLLAGKSISQTIFNPGFGYKNVSSYLSGKLEKLDLSDTCYAGYYYLKFSLNTAGKIIDLKTSKDLPGKSRTMISRQLDSCCQLWDKDFIKQVSREKKTILIPLLIIVDNNCMQAGNKFRDKLKADTTDSKEAQLAILNSALYEFAKEQLNIQQTFANSMDFTAEAGKQYMDCIILEPCFIRHLPLKGRIL